MSLRSEVVAMLRCPFCGLEVHVEKSILPAPDWGLQHGTLKCRACNFDYPVVDGIPIMMAPHESVDAKFETNALTMLEGPKVYEVTLALLSGEPIHALSLLFNPSKLDGNLLPALELPAPHDGSSGPLAPHGPSQSNPFGAVGRLVRRTPARARKTLARLVLPHARMRFADFVKTNEESLSAVDVMDLYYRQYSGTETYNYFAYRFGQPRHLAALALASLLGRTNGPVLDLACGMGHLTHFLSLARPGRAVLGLDRDFVRLWIASRYVAPAGTFVCASADQSLPFAPGLFGGVFCSDAFHYFLYRAASVREMIRSMVDDGILVVARFGNALVEPREGYELTPSGYARLFGDLRHVLVGEDALVGAYTARRSPDLDGAAAHHLDSQKWLSVVASRRADVFASGQAFADWPHAVGHLCINPLYRVENREPNGDLNLRFEFPSDWYKFENGAYLTYAPERVVLPGSVARAVERGEADPADPSLTPYVSQFVLLGLPERYRESTPAARSVSPLGPSATARSADSSVA